MKEKYFLWNRCFIEEGWSNNDRILYHGLSIAKYLNRIAIICCIPLDVYHNLFIDKYKISQRIYKQIDPKMIRRNCSIVKMISLKPYYDWEYIDSIVSSKMVEDLPNNVIDDISNNKDVEVIDKIRDSREYISKYLKIENNEVLPFHFYYDDQIAQKVYKYINPIIEKLRYSKNIKKIAKNIVKKIGEHDSIYIRRGDSNIYNTTVAGASLDYRIKVTDPYYVINKISKIIIPGRKLYIATNEIDLSFFDLFKERYDVYRLSDFYDIIRRESPQKCFNAYYLLCIEEEIMSQSYRFIGTPFSGIGISIDWMRSISDDKYIDKTIYNIDSDMYLKHIKEFGRTNKKRGEFRIVSFEYAMKRMFKL